MTESVDFPANLVSESESNMILDTSNPITSQLKDYLQSINIATNLEESDLSQIGSRVVQGFDEDKASCAEWMQQVEDAQKLVKLVREPKNYPLPKSANIKYPLITSACSQFASRTYPEIIKNGRVVKAVVIGADPTGEKEKRAERVARHMSYQLLYESDEWEQTLDKLLIMLANVGFVCKKTFFDPFTNRNRSILCNYDELIINTNIPNLKEARRISHLLTVHLNDLIEGARSGIYLKAVIEELQNSTPSDRYDEPIELIEQHRYLDLDDDGYEEPYIVTYCKKNNKVIRIVARYTDVDIKVNENNEVLRISPIHYFTDFHFLPSPDGKFHSLGFGTLMLHLNETINTILNQLIDSGTLANLRGGYIDARLKLPSGQTLHDQGEWKRIKSVGMVNLRDGILPIDYKEPSSVLFQLLNLLIQAGKDLSSSTEVLKGTQETSRSPASSVMAMIEQGLKELMAIQRRLYRSLKEEYQKLFRLNQIYLDPQEYTVILDEPLAIAQSDYETQSLDIMPIADPNLSNEMHRLVQDQALLAILDRPEPDKHEILRRHLELLNVAAPEKILPPPQPNQPPPLDAVKLQGELEDKAKKLDLKEREVKLKEQQFEADLVKQKIELMKLYAETIKTMAEAEAAEQGQQLDIYTSHVNAVKTKIDLLLRDQALDAQAAQQIAQQLNVTKDRELAQAQNIQEQNSAPKVI